jgi:hypothetical protein
VVSVIIPNLLDVTFLNRHTLMLYLLTFQKGFQLLRPSGRQTQRLVSRDLALRLRSILWIKLQEGSSCTRISGRLRQRLASQDLACASAAYCGLCCKHNMFIAARISGRQRQRLVSRDLTLPLRSILWIMLQVCLQLPRTSGMQRQRPVSQDLALRLGSKLWIILQEGSSC